LNISIDSGGYEGNSKYENRNSKTGLTRAAGIMEHMNQWLLIVAVLLAAGCDEPSPMPPATLEGAWTGQGVFRASAGEAQVSAQLELQSDGSYRLLLLEPAILALTGPEEGRWSRQDQTITLTPTPLEPVEDETSESVFRQLRRGSVPTAKTLSVAEDLRELRLRDGPMTLTFTFSPPPR